MVKKKKAISNKKKQGVVDNVDLNKKNAISSNKNQSKAVASIEQKRERRTLYMRTYRAKLKIASLMDNKPKGWRTERSKIYKGLIDNNKLLRKLDKKIGKPVIKIDRIKKGKVDKVKGIIEKSYVVWTFEGFLRDYLKNESFRYYKFINQNRRYDSTKSKISTILFAWDLSIDGVYGVSSRTPQVLVSEDYKNNTLTMEVY